MTSYEWSCWWRLSASCNNDTPNQAVIWIRTTHHPQLGAHWNNTRGIHLQYQHWCPSIHGICLMSSCARSVIHFRLEASSSNSRFYRVQEFIQHKFLCCNAGKPSSCNNESQGRCNSCMLICPNCCNNHPCLDQSGLWFKIHMTRSQPLQPRQLNGRCSFHH